MSYIEKKYREKISEIFNDLKLLDNQILEGFQEKSYSQSDKIAQYCSQCTKYVNLILKKYYPEIKDLNDKLQIKSVLKFYFDLIDRLTDFIRNVENFRKLDEKYYENMIQFITEREALISGKYYEISRRELTMFYDKATRDTLEKVLEEKLMAKDREYFTFGGLEEEIKKIARINGAYQIEFLPYKQVLEDMELISDPKTIINYVIDSNDEAILKKIGLAIKSYLISKGYEALVLIVESSEYKEEQGIMLGSIITNAKLFHNGITDG